MAKEEVQEVPTSLLSCPKCGEDMTIMGVTPSNDGKIIKLTVACEECLNVGFVTTKVASRMVVDQTGKVLSKE